MLDCKQKQNYAPVLCNSLPSHLRNSVHHFTSFSSTSSWLLYLWSSNFYLFKKIKPHLLRISFPPSICTQLGFCRTVISGIDPARPFHHIFISYQLIFTSFIIGNVCLFVWTTHVLTNNFALNCSTFISTINQPHFILFSIISS